MKFSLLKKILASGCIIGGALLPFMARADILPLSPTLPTTPSQSTVTPLPPAILPCYDFVGTLKLGSKGGRVKNLQFFLEREGMDIPAEEYGIFGDVTQDAVIQFQEKYSDQILKPIRQTSGNGIVGRLTRLKLNQLYGCDARGPLSYNLPTPEVTIQSGIQVKVPNQVSLQIANISLDATGLSATFCNRGAEDLPIAPFRIRLNGINRDFDVSDVRKANTCFTQNFGYSSWGLTFDPNSTYTAISIIDPYGIYKTNMLNFPISNTTTLAVPAIPGAHLSVRSLLLKTTGLQATFCNLGTVQLTKFPVRIVINGMIRNFDIQQAYTPGACQTMNWTYDTWSIGVVPGMQFNVKATVDPDNTISETNEFDNVATIFGVL